ncbi:hypothetical protein [Streptomyces sp. NPDC048623]|uniref:hypothetical protein n=1 Tax=Streptomyces sp. NPDC048623 TaxID=3155761 RepID=UPI003417115D
MTLNAPENGGQSTHFFFMSVRTAIGEFTHFSGAFTPRPGATRSEVFEWVYGELGRRRPEARGSSVIAFDVQPNGL